MAKDKEQLKQWLDDQAQEQYGEFGFATCNEDEQVEIVYGLVMTIMTTQSVYDGLFIIIV